MKTKKETKEVVQVSQADTVTINKLKTEKKPFEVYEDEDETIVKDPFELGSTQDKRQVGASSYGDNPTVDKELDADDEDGMGMMEGEMDEKFESKSQQKYFFAKCGDGKTPEQKKWCKMADEFASKTKNFKKLPEKVTERKTSQQVLEEALEKMILKHVQPRMTKKELISQIRTKQSFLCVGLDPDLQKIPKHLLEFEDPIFEFNKAIIDATHHLCVAYKPNTAFYECLGIAGWKSLEKTINYIPNDQKYIHSDRHLIVKD